MYRKHFKIFHTTNMTINILITHFNWGANTNFVTLEQSHLTDSSWSVCSPRSHQTQAVGSALAGMLQPHLSSYTPHQSYGLLYTLSTDTKSLCNTLTSTASIMHLMHGPAGHATHCHTKQPLTISQKSTAFNPLPSYNRGQTYTVHKVSRTTIYHNNWTAKNNRHELKKISLLAFL
jgi:hypothetical protein